MVAHKLFVSVAVLASVILVAGGLAPAQQKDKPAEVTKQDLVSKVPNFFSFDYPAEPLPGKRLWMRIDDKHFIERYPDGTESKFKILARGSVDGVQGTILTKFAGDENVAGTANDGGFQVFVPDRGSKTMEFRFRFKATDETWGNLGEMKNVE
jgi:hypothetical protein